MKTMLRLLPNLTPEHHVTVVYPDHTRFDISYQNGSYVIERHYPDGATMVLFEPERPWLHMPPVSSVKQLTCLSLDVRETTYSVARRMSFE